MIRALLGIGLARSLVVLVLVAMVGLVREAGAGYADFVVDIETGAVLRQTNADTPNYPASLTKIMTLFMVFEALDRGEMVMDEVLPVTRRATRQPPSKLGLRAGETIAVRDAILALVTKSANDVATVVAEHLGGTEAEFAKIMTRRARELGMSQTTFRNASGLPNKGQLTTARDISTLARALYRLYPTYAKIFATQRFDYRGRSYRNHNNLLGRYEGMNGIKTGYIRASGYNLAASVQQNGHHVIAVVLGGKTARSRDQQMRKLLDRAHVALAHHDTLLRQVRRPVSKPPRATLVAQAVPKPTVEPQPEPARIIDADTIAETASIAEAMPVVAVAMVDVDTHKNETAIRQAAVVVGDVLAEAVGIPTANAAMPEEERRWGVQVGAFAREDAALRALDHAILLVPEAFQFGQSEVSVIDDQFGTLFRARHRGLSESEARHVCALLKYQRLACVVAAPESNS